MTSQTVTRAALQAFLFILKVLLVAGGIILALTLFIARIVIVAVLGCLGISLAKGILTPATNPVSQAFKTVKKWE